MRVSQPNSMPAKVTPKTIREQLKALRRQRALRHLKARQASDSAPAAAQVKMPKVKAKRAQTQINSSALSGLPGAGPSLIWMLHECGITSLEELSKADPARLSERLGVVGQILDLEAWIAFARDA